jgi:precorrin-4/cobalt-precorrin-4 C11-methyltransferase
MVHIVGAGPGAEDLITVRGLRLLKQADIVIYAGSLVNPGLLKETKQGAVIYDSAKMTLEQVMEVIEQAWKEQKEVVRLHTGDPCLYGAPRPAAPAQAAVTPGIILISTPGYVADSSRIRPAIP